MARFIYLAGGTEAAQRWHCQQGHGQGWGCCFGDSPQKPQKINAASSTGWKNSFHLLICACLHWWGAHVPFLCRKFKRYHTVSVRKDTHTLNSCSLSPSCLVNWLTTIPSPGLLIPPVFIPPGMVAHSSGSIKSLHNLYLNSKQATDLACQQELEGFDVPGISTAINTIPWMVFNNNCAFQQYLNVLFPTITQNRAAGSSFWNRIGIKTYALAGEWHPLEQVFQ